MLDSTLTRIHVPGPVSRPDLRTFAGALRAVSRAPGFRDCQTFRGIDARDTLLVLVRWQDEATAMQASLRGGRRPREAAARDRAAGAGSPAPAAGPAAAGSAWPTVTGRDETIPLAGAFDLEFAPRAAAATLLRVAVGPRAPGAAAEARDRELALRVMAEPGSLRVAGARSIRHNLATCRIDFDLEDALWHFLESPLRREWSSLARRLHQQEIWALNLPRFHRQANAPRRSRPPRRPADPPPARQAGRSLCLELRVLSPGAAEIRFAGQLGPAGLARLQAMVASLVRDGCRTLTLDIRSLEASDAAGTRSLLQVVRRVKALGGEVRLVEQHDRFRRAVRMVNLERSLTTRG